MKNEISFLILSKSYFPKVFRFLLSGGFNTLVTWSVYVFLLKFVSYSWSYTLAFILGVLLGYIFNRYFVFQKTGISRALFWVVLIYLLQYLLGLIFVILWAKFFPSLVVFAPLIATALILPITYTLNSFVI